MRNWARWYPLIVKTNTELQKEEEKNQLNQNYFGTIGTRRGLDLVDSTEA